MKAMVRWAISKSSAMNVVLLSILAVGLLSGSLLRRERFPRFDLEIILVTVLYPGASPDEVESGVCQKVEEAVRSIDGVKKVTSVAQEGSGTVVIEVKSDAPSVQRVLGEVESEVDRIPSLPDLAEEPEIRQLTMRDPAITVGVVSDGNSSVESEVELREVAERVRDDLLLIPEISSTSIQGARDYQIDVEISETTLRKYGLTLGEVASRLRRQNVEVPAGNLKAEGQEFLLRGKNKRVRGVEIAEIPLVTQADGVVLTVGDLAKVRDEFIDTTSISRINGDPGLAIVVDAAAREDLLAMTEAVHEYCEKTSLPSGYRFETWNDASIDVRERLDLLKKNGLQGLLLVFVVLALFLELRLAFWVALGIPVAVLGACAVLWQFDQTLNMLSMFAFLVALGIVVDDAIVIGENIYAHRERGKRFLKAAIDGTAEVLPSVTTSIATTVLAFVPMFFVTGMMGKFFAVLPLAVIAMLLISLFESVLILPCHLAHERGEGVGGFLDRVRNGRANAPRLRFRWLGISLFLGLAFVLDQLYYPFRRLGAGLAWTNRLVGRGLSFFITRLYRPALRFSLRNPGVTLATAVSLLLVSCALLSNGTVRWVIFPKMDARVVRAKVVFPNGTPSQVTDQATRRMEEALLEVSHRLSDEVELVRLTHRLVGQVTTENVGGQDDLTQGAHAGMVSAELVDNGDRSVSSQEIVDAWREQVGNLPGVESLSFGSVGHGPGGTPIEFKLLSSSDQMEQLETVVQACKEKLEMYPGVFDVADDSSPGKWELQLKVKEDAQVLGIPLETIAGAVRSAYYGEEVMRLQRGRHEVKLMVRYPEEERRSLAQLEELRVDPGDGTKRPITELAEVDLGRGYSEINRLDQMRSITVTADLDEAVANASTIVAELRDDFVPSLLRDYPGITVRWEGQQEQTSESLQSLFVGLAIAMLATFVLLTLEFSSYLQPAIIMAIIPFGLIGVLWGHAAMGISFTIFSMLGLVALTGVVINDSIVLVDFVNARRKAGVPVAQAILESGERRFRPVVLTSLTTVAGLLPILTETSLQAQFLIPMANSLCFGLIFSTFLVLFLVPTLYSIYDRVVAKITGRAGEPWLGVGEADRLAGESGGDGGGVAVGVSGAMAWESCDPSRTEDRELRGPEETERLRKETSEDRDGSPIAG